MRSVPGSHGDDRPGARPAPPSWHAAGMPPAGTAVTVIVGDEELLVERAVHAAVAEVAAASAETPDVHDVRAADLRPGDLSTLTAPSLFGGGCLVIVRSAQDAAKDVAAELASLLAAPPPDVTLVLTHSGGAKNKSLLAGHGGQADRLPGGQAFRRAARLPARRVRPGRAEGRRRRAARAARRGRDRPARARGGVQPARRRHHRGDQPGAWSRGTTAAGRRRPGSRSPIARWKASWPRLWSSCAGPWPPASRRC